MRPEIKLLTCPLLLCLALASLQPVTAQGAAPEKIGIFDLKQIRSVPLEPELVDKKITGNIVTEAIRYTSRPGVRIFMYLSYPRGANRLPATVVVRNFDAETRVQDAKVGFVGVSICAPEDNQDKTLNKTVGGPPQNQYFTDDPEESWIYQHVVALVRLLDYLETRPEVNMKKIVIMGYSTSGFVTALMHAIDNRPCLYITWHGTGYYSDKEDMSGDKRSFLTRDEYEKYAPSAYAQYGTQPIFIANTLTDYYATLDGMIEMCTKLRSPKMLAFAPNRYHSSTMHNEYGGSGAWAWFYQSTGAPKPPTITEGKVTAENGRVFFKFSATASETMQPEIMYSYGKVGHWTGRTWHRTPAVKQGDQFVAEVPVYDPEVPFYVVGQIETKSYGGFANIPQFIEPKKLGITEANATYPKMLIDFEDSSDLYIASGVPTFIKDAAEGKVAASIEPFQDGTVHILDIEPFLWKDAKELHFFLKGDGKPGPVSLYLTYDVSYWLDKGRANYTEIPLIKDDEVFPAEWKEYVVPLDKVDERDKIDSMFFELDAGRKLLIDGIQWK